MDFFRSMAALPVSHDAIADQAQQALRHATAGGLFEFKRDHLYVELRNLGDWRLHDAWRLAYFCGWVWTKLFVFKKNNRFLYGKSLHCLTVDDPTWGADGTAIDIDVIPPDWSIPLAVSDLKTECPQFHFDAHDFAEKCHDAASSIDWEQFAPTEEAARAMKTLAASMRFFRRRRRAAGYPWTICFMQQMGKRRSGLQGAYTTIEDCVLDLVRRNFKPVDVVQWDPETRRSTNS